MSRPIKITPELKSQMAQDFIDYITKHGFDNGKVEFKKTYKWDGNGKASRALISFDPIAYLKMEMLIKNYTTEVAWHFVVERRDNAEYAAEYHIADTLHFPQKVTGCHFEQDDEKYQDWKFNSLDDYEFNNLRGHGHSHVNMPVSPSPTDENYQKDMVEAYNDFYLFVIWNKSGDRNVWIYDIEHNVLFETGDVDIIINSDEIDLNKFLDDSRRNTSYMGYSTQLSKYNKKKTATVTSITSKSSKKKKKKRADEVGKRSSKK